jgi:hypothetical protein
MFEFGYHYPSVGHAPQSREMLFTVSRNEYDFGVLLPDVVVPLRWAELEPWKTIKCTRRRRTSDLLPEIEKNTHLECELLRLGM